MSFKSINWALAGILTWASLAVPAHAEYFLLQLTPQTLNPDQRIHLVVSGRGNDLGTAPQEAAYAKAKRISETFPQDQILVISTKDNDNNQSSLKKLGYGSIKPVSATLDSTELMNQLSQYHRIVSLNVYGHSGIAPGVFLDRTPGTQNDLKWPAHDPNSARLKGHFTSDAVAIFNGCNVGHEQGPELAELWGIPVAGALTSTHFESIGSDGRYYEDGSMNACADGTNDCYRMKPDNADYSGVYGHYTQGLPFYKFFCIGISSEDCQKGMARSILTAVSTEKLGTHPTLKEFTNVVQDWLCPTGRPGQSPQAECMSKLDSLDFGATSSDRFYTPFGSVGHTAQCSFSTCYASCSNSNRETCAKTAKPPAQTTTFVEEYVGYLDGYRLLY